jgi:hypothetical protein
MDILRRARLTAGLRMSLAARTSCVSRRTIVVGSAEPDSSHRARLPILQEGGGRKKASLKDPKLLLDLEKLLSQCR